MSSRKRRPRNSIGLKAMAEMLMSATDDGEGHCTVAVSAVSVHALGAQLLRIADGEDARAVFTPGRRGRRSEGGRNYARAWAYWRHRAERPADVDGALECAQRLFPDLPKPSAGSIGREARRWRGVILMHLPVKEYRLNSHGGITRIASGIETDALLKYLSKKSKRGRS